MSAFQKCKVNCPSECDRSSHLAQSLLSVMD